MGTTAAIIGLISSVLGIVWFLVRRKFEAPPLTPHEKVEAARSDVAKEIIADDAVAANKRLDEWLHNPALRGSEQRQGSAANETGSSTGSRA